MSESSLPRTYPPFLITHTAAPPPPTYHVFRMYVPFQDAPFVLEPFSAKAQGGKLSLRLEPKSVTVVSVEQWTRGRA